MINCAVDGTSFAKKIIVNALRRVPGFELLEKSRARYGVSIADSPQLCPADAQFLCELCICHVSLKLHQLFNVDVCHIHSSFLHYFDRSVFLMEHLYTITVVRSMQHAVAKSVKFVASMEHGWYTKAVSEK